MAKKHGFTHESQHNESQEWYTPKSIFDALGLQFDLDPCSPGKDVVPWVPATNHMTLKDDGLKSAWYGIPFVNPPYGQDTPAWMEKLAKYGKGIGLVFARTDTKWFQTYGKKADVICFISGRIKFVPATQAENYMKGISPKGNGCGAGSMLLGYGEECYKAIMNCKLGATFVSKL